MADTLVIDGSYGEGGGQILRTSLALAAIIGRPLRIEKIRAGRKAPGLAAQHLTAVHAVAAVCHARVRGDALGSQTLVFEPGGAPLANSYLFDVAEEREGGSAGATTLVLHAVLPPLAMLAYAPDPSIDPALGLKGDSAVSIRGGTHVSWSPPFDYARDVWLPTLARMGVRGNLDLLHWGWYPAGQGEIRAGLASLRPGQRLSPLNLVERGALRRVWGRAVAANLPSHIPQRMADRARSLLSAAGIDARIDPQRVRAVSAGAGIFLTAEYEHARAGFSALGTKGKASEAVAEEAVAALLAHRDSGAALDEHLADQLMLPMARASGRSSFSTERISRHLTTNAWVVEQFGAAQVSIEGGQVIIESLISNLHTGVRDW
jgi:RNA 3'-terminal phosphate cyclase (ATP)